MKLKKQTRKLAKKAGFVFWSDESWGPGPTQIDWSCNYDKELETLVALVAEECAKLTLDHNAHGPYIAIKTHFKLNMKKVTTADCKQFLVDEISKNPQIINDIFKDTTTGIAAALTRSKWVRESKFKPDGDHDYAQDEYELWAPMHGPIPASIPASKLRAVRRFCLDPDQFDSTVVFNVLEDLNGQLILGEYMGD